MKFHNCHYTNGGIKDNHLKFSGTNRYFRKVAVNMGIETSFVDLTDITKVAEAIRPNTKMIWIETPTNPTLKVIDIQEVSNIAHGHENIIVVVDNTFESAYFQRYVKFSRILN